MSNPRAHDLDRLLLTRMALGLGIAFTAIAAAVGFFLFTLHRIGLAGFIGVVALGPATAAVVTTLIWSGTGLASRSIVQVITGAGNIKPAPSYSLQESLVARGRYQDAEESFLAHLAVEPQDQTARLALAALYRDHLGDPARAEGLFLEVRRSEPTQAQEFAIANALIDLYRTTGQTGREMGELARFADRFRGSEAGARATEALRRLKERPG